LIQVITDIQEMRPLKKQWDRLAKSFKTPLLQYEWFIACAEFLCQPGYLRIVVDCARGEITALAPIALMVNNGIERLEILGAAILDEPTGFIYSNEDSLGKVINAIGRMGKPLLLRGLRTGSPEVDTLCRSNTGKYFLKSVAGSPFFDVRETWDEYLPRMTSDNRNHLKRKQKQLGERGKIRYEINAPNAENVMSYFEEILRVEASGWKGEKETAMAFDDPLKNFYTAYAIDAARRGCLRFCTLRVDGKPIAIQLAILHSNRFWLLKVGYDAAWKRYSPGVLLTHETIRYAFQHGLDGYEFLGHDEPWIHRWTRRTHSHIIFRSYPYSIKGIETFARDSIHSILNKMSKV